MMATLSMDACDLSIADERDDCCVPAEKIEYGIRLPYPSVEEARHFTRRLEWLECFPFNTVSESMRGGDFDMSCFSVEELVSSLDGFRRVGSAVSPVGSVMIDIDRLIRWYRETIGDEDLACALEQRVSSYEHYTAQLDVAFALAIARFWQYREVLDECAEEEMDDSEKYGEKTAVADGGED